MENMINILEKLINFPSVTPKGEDAIRFIADILSKLDFKCDIQKFGPDNNQKVTNLYAVRGSNKPNICFAGHVDVVPPGDRNLWNHDPFSMHINNNILYGRGAVDMKGAIAVGIAAVAEFIEKYPDFDKKGSISFLITSDEEGKAYYGTKMMLPYIKEHYPKIDFCILGEPTTQNNIGDTVKIGRRGSISFALTARGKQGHAAYPEKAINPITIMLNILKALNEADFDSHVSQDFPATNLEVTSIDTDNLATNVIPEQLIAKFNIRFNDQHSSDSLYETVNNIVSQYSHDYTLDYHCNAESFMQKKSPQIKNFLSIVEDVCNITPKLETVGGTSDARFIHQYTELVEFGLNCNQAHKINENTSINDLQLLYKVYYHTLVNMILDL